MAKNRLPRQIPPIRIEESYAAALVKIVRRARAAWAPVIRAVPQLVEDARAAREDHMDAGESDKLRRLVAEAVAATSKAIQQPELMSLAAKFGRRVVDYQKSQLARQVKAALGVDPVFKDKGLVARLDQFTHHNVSLVERIPKRLHGDLESIVTHAVASGRLSGGRSRNPDSLRQDIEDRFDISERHARVIARDQVGKMFAGINHARQKEMGVTQFIWRTVGDPRVRDEHDEIDGDTFDYDDPPNVGPYGEPALPGEAVQCRCWADPIFDEGDEGDEESDDEGTD